MILNHSKNNKDRKSLTCQQFDDDLKQTRDFAVIVILL